MNLYDSLIQVATQADQRPVKAVQLGWIITLTAEGTVVSARKAPEKRRALILADTRGSAVAPLPGVVETAIYACATPKNGSAVAAQKAAERQTAYAERLQLDAARVEDPALRTTLLAVRTAVLAGNPGLSAKYLDWVQFQIQGLPDATLHPEVVAIHGATLLEKQGRPVYGTCPFCEQNAVQLTRLYGSAGPAALVSFNNASSCGYGKKAGYNAPCCLTCSSAMQRGLRHVLQRNRLATPRGSTLACLWWSAKEAGRFWDLGGDLWGQREAPETPGEAAPVGGDEDEDGEMLLDETPDETPEVTPLPAETTFLILDQNKTRWAQRFHGTVQREACLARLAHWRAAVGPWWIGFMVNALLGRDRRRGKADTSWDAIYAQLLVHLLGGEPLPPVYATWAQRPGGDERHEATKAKLITYMTEDSMVQNDLLKIDPDGANLTGVDLGHYLFGRAYARAAGCQWRTAQGKELHRGYARASAQDTLQLQGEVRRLLFWVDKKKNRHADAVGEDLVAAAQAAGILQSPTPRLQATFCAGYWTQVKLDRAAMEARKAAREAAKAAGLPLPESDPEADEDPS